MQERSAVRDRLLAGMLDAVERNGYSTTTILDVVKAAGVSKRTFYEHFPTKEDCFVAAYLFASAEVMKQIEDAALRERNWDARIASCIDSYLRTLESRRALTRVFLLEIHAAGPAAMRARRDVHGRFAELLRSLVVKARHEVPELKTLSPKLAIALVGGLNELVLVALERETEGLNQLAGAATELVRAVITR